MMTATTEMSQSEVTPKTVAGVCDPGIPTTAGLKEASYNAGPTEARDDRPGVAPKKAFLNHAQRRIIRMTHPMGASEVRLQLTSFRAQLGRS
jgi:hypothetical protein